MQTFEITFPFLKSGGAYFIEDWGTGYWKNFPDGGEYSEPNFFSCDKNMPTKITSHAFGMVGFVKSLIDLCHEDAIKGDQLAETNRKSRIRSLEFAAGVVMIIKA
jgi:hypothetical protein